ncbi:MAG: flagellar biosynthesis protein FliQ [Bdellovibrionaceae bacterium]|nr:flagellar biosynthesis protein FliQ [Pseudobdellovibrionaceae bacterium]
MTEDVVITLGTMSLKTIAMVSAPLLIGALVIGIAVSIFQAITQINEATLTFIPKMVIVAIIILLAGPWMLNTLKGFTVEMLGNAGEIVRSK